MYHRWTGVWDPALTRGVGSTGRASKRLRIIRGMSLWLIVVGHIRGSVWWQHRTVHEGRVLHLRHALPWLLGLRGATLN